MRIARLKKDLAECKDIFDTEQQALTETLQWICGLKQTIDELKIYEKDAEAKLNKNPADTEASQLLQNVVAMQQSYEETLDQFFVKRDRHQKTLESITQLMTNLEQALEEETMPADPWQRATPLEFLWKKLRPI